MLLLLYVVVGGCVGVLGLVVVVDGVIIGICLLV